MAPQVRAGDDPTHAVTDDGHPRGAGREKDRIDLFGDLFGEILDRRQRRAVRQRVHRTDAGCDEMRAQTAPNARIAQHAMG